MNALACSHCDIPRIDRASNGSEEFFGVGPAATFKVTLHCAPCGEGLPIVTVVRPSEAWLRGAKSGILTAEFIQAAEGRAVASAAGRSRQGRMLASEGPAGPRKKRTNTASSRKLYRLGRLSSRLSPLVASRLVVIPVFDR